MPATAPDTGLGLAALLGGMTVLHLVEADTFEAMVPTWLPGSRTTWNLLATASEGPSAIARLPLQVPMVLWAVRVARRAGPRD